MSGSDKLGRQLGTGTIPEGVEFRVTRFGRDTLECLAS